MIDLFHNISTKNKERLLYTLESNALFYKKNTQILAQIKKEHTIGFIVSGSVQIKRTDYNGNELIIEDLKDNDIFGSNISSLTNPEISMTTKEDTKLIIIDYERIIKEDNRNPYYIQFIKNLLEIITELITEKNERIEILSKKSIRDKLLEYFRLTSSKTGSRVIYLPLSYTALADYLATDRSAMTREMKHLVEEGFIRKENKKITLLY